MSKESRLKTLYRSDQETEKKPGPLCKSSALGAALPFDSVAFYAGGLGSALPLPFFFGVAGLFFFGAGGGSSHAAASFFTFLGLGVGVRGRFGAPLVVD